MYFKEFSILINIFFFAVNKYRRRMLERDNNISRGMRNVFFFSKI